MSHESISRLERGEQWPPFAVLAQLAETYGVEVADLLAVRSAQRAAIQVVVDLLRSRKTSEVELVRGLIRTLFE